MSGILKRIDETNSATRFLYTVLTVTAQLNNPERYQREFPEDNVLNAGIGFHPFDSSTLPSDLSVKKPSQSGANSTTAEYREYKIETWYLTRLLRVSAHYRHVFWKIIKNIQTVYGRQ